MVCFAASGNGKRQTPQIFQKLFEKLMILASRSLLGKRLGGFLERSGGLSACIGTILGVLGSPLGRPHGGFLERLGGFLTRLGAILGVLGRCLGDSGPSWAVIAASWGPLGLSWSLLGPQKVMRGVAGSPRWDATNPRLIATRGSEPWKNSSGVTTEAQGRVRGREEIILFPGKLGYFPVNWVLPRLQKSYEAFKASEDFLRAYVEPLRAASGGPLERL